MDKGEFAQAATEVQQKAAQRREAQVSKAQERAIKLNESIRLARSIAEKASLLLAFAGVQETGTINVGHDPTHETKKQIGEVIWLGPVDESAKRLHGFAQVEAASTQTVGRYEDMPKRRWIRKSILEKVFVPVEEKPVVEGVSLRLSTSEKSDGSNLLTVERLAAGRYVWASQATPRSYEYSLDELISLQKRDEAHPSFLDVPSHLEGDAEAWQLRKLDDSLDFVLDSLA